MNARPILAGAVLLLAAGFAAALFFGDGGEAAPTTAFVRSDQCADCHRAVYDEWNASEHANAWTGQEVRALSNDFANQDCIDCHAPQPVFLTGLGNRVLPRTLNRVDGVDCLTCHALPDGGVAASFTDPSVPCRPVQQVDLTRAVHCAGCHDQHQTVQQWAGSDYAARGVSCVDCHMPHRGGDPNAGRDHTMHGGASIENVREAVELRGEKSLMGWVVTVANVGAGHSFPTDERSRAADVFWRPLVAEGAEPGPWQHLYRFRSPYRWETDIDDTLLLVHEARDIPVVDGGPAFIRSGGIEGGTPVVGPIEVALFYKRAPFYDDPEQPDPENEAWLVQRIELVP